jgi:hypothetical protein
LVGVLALLARAKGGAIRRRIGTLEIDELARTATVAGMLEAERQFRRIIGYSDLAKLAVTVERELTPPQPNPVTTEEAAIVATA